MWKHKTKWLVRGGRKVRCYLCGKKILAKGDLFLFHGDTGYYSHQSCMTESTTISGNERRRAVKKIAVGAAVVGAIAAGAGKLIDISSQSKGSNSPAAQTILTSQGLILPALTSDPANPVAGQMWYRSDKGVTAHFDAIENRVIYSNRIVNGSEVVSAKGIVNGLSVLPNDGQDWGPDTTKGATAPGQYGAPYTQTFGIMESLEDVYAQKGGVVKILPGFYDLTNAPLLPNVDATRYSKIMIPFGGYTTNQMTITIEGSGFQNQFETYPNGTVIFDGTTTLTETYQSVIDANGTGGSAGFNGVSVSLSNHSVVQSQGGSGISGIDFSYTTMAFFDKVIASVQYINTPVSPSTGIKFPVEGCEFSYAGSLIVVGYYNGIQTGEHMHIDDIYTEYCVNAIYVADLANDSNIVQMLSRACETIIYNSENANSSSMLWIGKIHVTDLTSPYGGTAQYYINNIVPAACPIYIGVWHAHSPVLASLNAGIFDNNNYDTAGLIHIDKVYPPSFAVTTTPAVPASATAQQNLNPYAVGVYINGGNVTEIQITKDGTAYTVFSNSTGLAFSGQHYPLDPLDSITVTFTTAPTWEWLSD